MPTPANSINEATTGIVGFTGTAFTATAVTNHAVIIGGSTSSTLTNLGPTATAGQVLQSGGAAADPAFSTATFPATATGTGTILRADGTNWVATTSTYPNTNAVSTLLYASSANVMAALATGNNGLLVTGNTGIPSILAGPGTTGQVLQANAAAAPSYSTATYPSVGTGTGTILRADGTNWVATTATYPATTTASQLLYSSATSVVGGLTTANNGMLVTSSAGVPSILAGPGTTGNILQSNAAAAPSFSTATYPAIATGTGTLLRADGTNWVATTSTYPNTNAVSTLLYASASNVMSALATANNGLYVTGNTGIPSILAGPGTTGNMLQANAAAAPSYSTSTYPATNAVSTLLYASSSNVMAALATGNDGVLITSHTGVPSWLAGGTTGQILTATTNSPPTWAAAAASLTWTVITANQSAVAANGYICNKAGLLALTLPASGAIGDIIEVTGINTALGWSIAQNANQQIFFGTSSTTVGVTGSIASVNIRDSIKIVCVVSGASTVWNVTSAIGNVTVT